MLESYRTRSVSRLQTKQEGFTLRRSRAASFAGCGKRGGKRQETKRGHLDVSREPRCAWDGIAASILIEIKASIDWLQELSGWPHLRVHDEPTHGDRRWDEQSIAISGSPETPLTRFLAQRAGNRSKRATTWMARTLGKAITRLLNAKEMISTITRTLPPGGSVCSTAKCLVME